MADASGLPASDALGCLARLKGHDGSPAAFRDAHGAELEPEALAPALARLGLQARPARIRREDLPFLHLPTLARLRDGSWVVVRGRGRKGYSILDSRGAVALRPQRLWAMLDGQVLDFSPMLPASGTLWARLRGLMAHHRGVLSMIVIATALLQLLALVTPALTGVVMNRALPGGAQGLLALAAAGIVLMALSRAGIGLVRGRALLCFTRRMEASAERGLLEHILGLPFPQLRGRPVGEWLQAFGAFASARDLLAEKTLGVFLDGALALVLLAAMAFLLPGAAAVVAASALAMACASVLAGRVEARLQAREVEVRVKEQSWLSQLLGGIATLRAGGAEERALGRWRALFRQGQILALRRGRIALGTGAALSALGQGVDTGFLVWGGLQVVRDHLGLGTFLAFLQLAAGFTEAVLGLSATCLRLWVLAPQLAKASGILELAPQAPPPAQPAHPGPVTVEMANVWFRYRPDGPWVLSGCELRLEAGDKFRLPGPSGWGKSTLLRLLSGLEAPEKGEILIGGRAPALARQNLIYLPQFAQLCGGSILENLAMLSGGAPPKAILDAAALTGLAEWIATLPMGLKTLLPHGGGTLSGGQRQWIAVTAALASGRGLLLMDEPLASMDPIVSARLRRVLESGGWTLVAAGH